MSNETIDQNMPDRGNLEIKPEAIKWGIIGGLASILVSLILYFLNMKLESWSRWVSSGVMVAAIIIGIKNIAEANRGKIVPFGSLFGGGMLITVIIAVISIVYFLIYMNFIDPDFISRVLDMTRVQMEQKGLSEEQIEKSLAMSQKFMSPGLMVLFSFIGQTVIGAIGSLIGAAVFKKER
jgi:hypothetical protein